MRHNLAMPRCACDDQWATPELVLAMLKQEVNEQTFLQKTYHLWKNYKLAIRAWHCQGDTNRSMFAIIYCSGRHTLPMYQRVKTYKWVCHTISWAHSEMRGVAKRDNKTER